MASPVSFNVSRNHPSIASTSADDCKHIHLPPLPALLETPFWLDPSDPHRMRSAVQFLTLPHFQEYVVLLGDWRYGKVDHELVWEKTIHRIVTEGITPEQATDEAIARVKQLLSE